MTPIPAVTKVFLPHCVQLLVDYIFVAFFVTLFSKTAQILTSRRIMRHWARSISPTNRAFERVIYGMTTPRVQRTRDIATK